MALHPRRISSWISHRVLIATFIGVVLAFWVGPGRAFAHADLVAANPTPNSVLGSAVSEITLTFSEPVTLIAPGITVAGNGQTITTAPRLEGKTVRAALSSPIGAGTYDVTWNVRAADGHETTASYSFSIAAGVSAPAAPGTTVAPDATTSTVAETTTSTTNPLIQPRDAPSTSAPRTSPTSSTAPDRAQNWLIYLAIGVGIVLVALAVGGIVRLVRKRR